MLGPLLIRADANSKIGSGHVMRCIALAQAWRRRGGDVMFYGNIDDAIGKKILAEKFGLCTGEIDMSGFDWIVVDGYSFDSNYVLTLQMNGHRVLLVSDYLNSKKYVAEIVLNQNIGASNIPYSPQNEDVRYLLGTEFAMLREEFLNISAPTRKRKVPDIASSLLITMGGADPDNVTTTIIKALELIDIPLQPTVIVGGSNQHYDEICKAIDSSKHHYHIHRNVEDMQNHIIWSDLAISAGGSTCWELAYLGTPMALVTIADNQAAIVVGLREAGVALDLGLQEDLDITIVAEQLTTLIKDQKRRDEMQRNGQKIVDGNGADRVVKAMIGASK